MFQKIINKLNDLRPRQLLGLAGLAAMLMFVTIYIGMSFLVNEEVIEKAEEEKPVEKIAVVVAKVNIPPRTRIQDTMLQMKEFPSDMVPEGAITNFDDVLNVQIKVSIFAGDILTIQKVFTDKSAEGFIGTIPPECRAVSISINDITGVAGFAKPGDFVDLILTEKGDYAATSNILLQNVLLLSINQDMGNNMIDTNGGGQAISNPTIATFALRPAEILKLISATKIGEIYMSLRPADPQSAYVGEMEYTIESITAPPPKQEPEPVYREPVYQEPATVIPDTPLPVLPAPTLTPPVPKIEIIQGDEIVQEADEEPQVVMPNVPAGGADVPLPVIPSRSESMPRASQPLAGAPFVGSNVIRPPGGN